MTRFAKRKKIFFWGLVIFVFSFLIYANSLNNQFLAGDDQNIILNNRYLCSGKYFFKFFSENYIAGSGILSNYWRPYQLVIYSIIRQTLGLRPWGFHLASIIFHSLCGLFLFFIFLKFFYRKTPLPLLVLIILLWLAHPLHNEELAGTSGICSPAYLFWMLSGLVCFIKFQASSRLGWWYLLSVGCFALALFSKESAIIFPALLLGMHLTGIKLAKFKRLKAKPFCLIHFSYWLLAFIYVVLRLTVLNFRNTLNFYNQNNILTQHLSYRFYNLFTTLAYGLKIIFLPLGLHPEKSWPVFSSFFIFPVWASFLVITLIIGLAFFCWKKTPIFSFGIFWFIVSYLPMSNLFAQINALVWDHWFYVSAIGIALSLASLLQIRRLEKLSYTILILVLAAFSVMTVARNQYWKDTETVSRFILSYEPRLSKTWSNLGLSLAEKGKHEQALSCYLKSLELGDCFPQTHYNLANLYLGTGKALLAQQEYLRALWLDSRFYPAYLGLGQFYLARGQTNEAAFYFKKALEIYPDLPEIKNFLGQPKQ